MGMTSMSFTPLAASSFTVSGVEGVSHFIGPTFDW